MTRWWIRPLVRLVAALLLPVAVPAILTLLIWALPGDPASIICPPETCGGSAGLAERWHLDDGPMGFFRHWAAGALHGDFGRSWRMLQGVEVGELLAEAVPTTLVLLALAGVPVGLGVVGAVTGRLPAKADPLFHVLGLMPSIVLGLAAAALVQLEFGAGAFDGSARWARLVGGALVLAFSDGALAGAVTGTRGLFSAEARQRYVGIAVLRGETVLSNTLPNVAPALVGQLRARVLHLLSGAVIVEALLEINGLGDLLWGGTIWQDFGVVLAAATAFAVLSAALLVVQAVAEVLVALHVRRAPAVGAE